MRREGLVGAVRETTNYQVTVEREPGFWIVRVPEVPEVVTQARRMAEVKENARQAIAVWTDRPIDDIDVTVTVVVPTVVQAALDEAQRLQREAGERLERAGTATSEAARWLTKELGMTLREAAEDPRRVLPTGGTTSRAERAPPGVVPPFTTRPEDGRIGTYPSWHYALSRTPTSALA